MRVSALFAACSALALLLSGCGGDSNEVSDQINQAADGEGATRDAAVTPAQADETATMEADEAGEAGDAAEGEGAPAPTDTPSPAPSASATTRAAAPTAAPAPVAAAGPPQSFATCAVCHSVQRGQNGIGPSLAGVFGRRAGSVPGANYSAAMQGATITWNEGNLDRYLADPAAVVPGTTMPPPGLNPAQRREVIAYLRTL